MEDLPTSLLMQQEQARPRTGEELETFGKYASKLYLGGVCGTLTEAVVQTVKTAGLVPEQVKRVVEFANTSAYLDKFASAGADHKVITFEGGPASFPDVIKDLNDGGNATPLDKVASFEDYLLPPPDVETLASNNLLRLGLVDTKLAQAFAVQEVPIPYAEPLREAEDMKLKLAGVYDQAVSSLSGLETRYMDLCDLLYGQVKQAALEGVPLGHVLQILAQANPDPEFCKSAFAMMAPKLVAVEVFPSHTAIANSLQKTAGAGLVNQSHPLVGIYEDYCDTLTKMAATRLVQDEIAQQLDVLSTFLVKAATAAQAGEAAGKVLSTIPKAWRAVTGATARASQPVEEFVSKAVGPNAGWAAGGAVKYAPHAAALLAGEEVYQRAKANPLINASSNFVMGRIPYTSQNMIRQYQLQSGI